MYSESEICIHDAVCGITFRGSMADVLCRQSGFILGESGDHESHHREENFFFLSETNREPKGYHLMWDKRLYLASLYIYLYLDFVIYLCIFRYISIYCCIL